MDYVRYLRSKTSVDNRALNKDVLSDLLNHIDKHVDNCANGVKIGEVGAGVGAMFLRLLHKTRNFQNVSQLQYIMIDIKKQVLQAAYQDIQQYCQSNLVHLQTAIDSNKNTSSAAPIEKSNNNNIINNVHLYGNWEKQSGHFATLYINNNITVDFVQMDALSYLNQNQGTCNLIIAAAVLDIWDLETAVNTILNALDNTSSLRAFYFPINFDGVTDFFPHTQLGEAYDFQVEENFHKTMGQRIICGEKVAACYSGRRLLPVLNNTKACIQSSGSSAWIVQPTNKKYPSDEAYFLSCILDIMEKEVNALLSKAPEQEKQTFERYIDKRRNQVLHGELFYVAHNIDVFGTI